MQYVDFTWAYAGLSCFVLICFRIGHGEELCTSKPCQIIAEFFSMNMDRDIHPCDDFYQYACGKYSTNNLLSLPNSDLVNFRTEVYNKILQEAIEYFQVPRVDEPEAVKKARWYYGSCKDDDAIENLGLVPLTTFLKKTLLPVKPPFLEAVETERGSLGIILGKIRRLFDSVFPFTITVGLDKEDPLTNVLQIRVTKRNSLMKVYKLTSSSKNSTLETSNSNYATISTGNEDNEEEKSTDRINSGAGAENLESHSVKKSAHQSKLENTVTTAEKKKKQKANENSERFSTRELTSARVSSTSTTSTESRRKHKSSRTKPKSNKPRKEFSIMTPNILIYDFQKNKITHIQPPKTENYIRLPGPAVNPYIEFVPQKSDKQAMADFIFNVTDAIFNKLNIKISPKNIQNVRTRINKVVSKLKQFEQIMRQVERDESQERKMTLTELQKFTDSLAEKTGKQPTINWTEFIESLFSDVPALIQDYKKGNRKIYIENIDYLQKVLIKLSETAPKILNGILWWVTVNSKLLDSTEELRSLVEEYHLEVGLPILFREEYCMERTIKRFPFAVAYPMIHDSSSVKNINHALNTIIKYSIRSLGQYIRLNTILDMKTIMAATHKLTAADLQLGFPETLLKNKELNKLYSNIMPQKRNFFFSRLLNHFDETSKALQSIRTPNPDLRTLASKKWLSPYSTGVVSDPQLHTLSVPLSLFRFPYYQHSVEAINFGFLGTEIIRDILNLFIGEGSKFSSAGIRERWWKKKTLEIYGSKAKCYVQGYEPMLKEFYRNETLNADSFIDEAISDHVTFELLVLSYKAYIQETKIEEMRVNELEPLQLLTLAFAQTMCSRESREHLHTIKKNKSAPVAVRVRGTVMNSFQFSRIWNCKENSPMNPPNKCRQGMPIANKINTIHLTN